MKRERAKAIRADFEASRIYIPPLAGLPHCEAECDPMTQNFAFICNRCERLCCPCIGANDEMPELCNDCAVLVGWFNDDSKASKEPS